MSNREMDGAARWSARGKVAFWVFAAVGAFFLIAEHRAHLVPYLPWLLLLACPLMHIFHHRHGGHGSHADESSPKNASTPAAHEHH